MMGAYAFANKLIMAGCSTLLCVWVCLCVFLLHTDAKQNHPGFGNPSAQLSNTFEPSSLEMPTCLGPPKVSVVQRTSVSGRHRKQRDGRFSRSIWNQKTNFLFSWWTYYVFQFGTVHQHCEKNRCAMNLHTKSSPFGSLAQILSRAYPTSCTTRGSVSIPILLLTIP